MSTVNYFFLNTEQNGVFAAYYCSTLFQPMFFFFLLLSENSFFHPPRTQALMSPVCSCPVSASVTFGFKLQLPGQPLSWQLDAQRDLQLSNTEQEVLLICLQSRQITSTQECTLWGCVNNRAGCDYRSFFSKCSTSLLHPPAYATVGLVTDWNLKINKANVYIINN